MTDHVRELQSVELGIQQAEERGDDTAADALREQLDARVATCRVELARLEANPPTYGSADYVQDVDPVARVRDVLAKYDDEPTEEAEAPAAAKRGRPRKTENTADSKPKETA